MHLEVRYTPNKVIVIEFDDSNRFKVSEWSRDSEFVTNNNIELLAETDPSRLIRESHESVDNWKQVRSQYKW